MNLSEKLMFSKYLLLIAALSLLPLSVASAETEEAKPAEAKAAAEPADKVVASPNKTKTDGTNLGRVLGDWQAPGAVTINIADDFIRFTTRDGSEDSPMNVESQEGNKIVAQLTDDDGKKTERVVVDILGKGSITMTWETGKKKGKTLELTRGGAARAKK